MSSKVRSRSCLTKKTAAAVAVVAMLSSPTAHAFQSTTSSSARRHPASALSVVTDPMTLFDRDVTLRLMDPPKRAGATNPSDGYTRKKLLRQKRAKEDQQQQQQLLFEETDKPFFAAEATTATPTRQRKQPRTSPKVVTTPQKIVKTSTKAQLRTLAPKVTTKAAAQLRTSPKVIATPKQIIKTPTNAYIKKQQKRSTTLPRKSRSSTMPGYAVPTKNQSSQAQKIQQIEDLTGKDLSKTLPRKKKAAQVSGEAMYLASISVPESLMQFARELHQEDRITPSEELELGRLTQEAIQLQSLYDNLQDTLQREPTDDEWCAAAGKINVEAIRQTLEEGMEAKNKLVTSNLRMVQGVVNVYIRNGLSGQYNAGDLMQDGIVALIRAAEKFEPQRGFRFSTYAMYWIRSAVKRSQLFQSRVINIPQRLHANHKKVTVTRKQLQHVLGRPPTDEELADAVGMSLAQLDRCVKSMEQKCFSLDQQLNNRNKPSEIHRKDTMYDVIESKKGAGGGEEDCRISRTFLREDLIESLYRSLDKESAHIIMLRYGLVDDTSILPTGYEGPLTIAQVSQLVGMKPDKVRRKIIKSLKDLKDTIGNEWRDFERVMVE